VKRFSARLGLSLATCLAFGGPTWAQSAPSPSQVAPPVVPPAPGGARIALPQVPAGATVPEQAKKLSFRLLSFDIEGEFPELASQRQAIAAPLIGKRITVADLFGFADQLQQIYVRAGYPLVRVVILPQEFEGSARIKLRVIDGFIERMEFDAIPPPVRNRIALVLAPLLNRTHLRQAELERQLLIAGEAPGLILNAVFAAGKEVGGSVLVLAGRYRPASASLYSDNAMPAVFGNAQLVATASLNSVLGLGEQFTASAAGLPDKDFTTSFPTRRYLTGSFLIPLGIDGWKLELGGSNGVTTPRVNQLTATQGNLWQGRARLSYDLVKLRDFEFTLNGRFDATNEEIETLAFTPPLPLSIDRTRVLRGGFDGIWRLRQTGTTIAFGTSFSRGLSGLGARNAADADPLVPLSRAGADAVFSKWDGRIEVTQGLPYDFFASLGAFGQTSFNHPLLTSEQFDITGARLLSGFTSGALAGDSAWAVRGELGRPFAIPVETGGLTVTPYVFYATGERILENPSVLEFGSIHATSFGAGTRVNLVPWANWMADGYGFIEWSRRRTDNARLDGDRLFVGALVRY
jgi:hemolysin activation/secretion protein